MIKITQEFENEREAKVALSSNDYWSALWELDQHLRDQLKHHDLSVDEYDTTDRIREKLSSIMNSNGVSFDDIL